MRNVNDPAQAFEGDLGTGRAPALRGKAMEQLPEQKQPRRGGVLADLEVSFADDGRMTINDDKFGDGSARAVEPTSQSLALRHSSVANINGFDIPVDEGDDERMNSGDSDDPILATIFKVLDGLEKSAGSSKVTSEARALVRIIARNMEIKRRRKNLTDADRGQEEKDGTYRETKPESAAMGLRNRRQRPQTDAEAEKLVAQLYSKKHFRSTAAQ